MYWVKHIAKKSKNSEIMSDYYSIPNLSFVGHVEGEEKIKYLKEAKILVNTSIHEALPISFLEALSYGTLLVSNRNPEDLTSKFGIHVGDVLGDGFDKIDLYVNAIHQLLNDEENRKKVSSEAISYIKNTHDVDKIVPKLRNAIIEQIQSK
ncbi:glycosyltransferase involved in cell wall biosynthesis [Acinetobacter baylyi]|nr:glycosyltransferase involved in cell wall biosynthesis [Acinetobacter baylyi]